MRSGFIVQGFVFIKLLFLLYVGPFVHLPLGRELRILQLQGGRWDEPRRCEGGSEMLFEIFHLSGASACRLCFFAETHEREAAQP